MISDLVLRGSSYGLFLFTKSLIFARANVFRMSAFVAQPLAAVARPKPIRPSAEALWASVPMASFTPFSTANLQ